MSFIPDDFILRALLAGSAIALIAAPLGCFILWRRMAYFGATIAHSGLLGAALGVSLAINPVFSVILISFAVAALLLWLEKHTELPSDALMGFLAHTTLAGGVIVSSLIEGQRFDLVGYLFGDIFAVQNSDLLWIIIGGTVVLITVYYLWKPLIALSIHEELASAEGQNADRVKSIFIFLLAFTIAIAMKIIGILLIIAFLIMPPSIARGFANSPEEMLAWTALIAIVSVVAGVGLAYVMNTPGGPTIVVVMAALLFLAQIRTLRSA